VSPVPTPAAGASKLARRASEILESYAGFLEGAGGARDGGPTRQRRFRSTAVAALGLPPALLPPFKAESRFGTAVLRLPPRSKNLGNDQGYYLPLWVADITS